MYTRVNAVRAAPAILLAALLALPVPILSEPAATPRTLSVWFESATVKVKPQDPALASSAVWDGSAIRLSAARGEHEAFQAVIDVPADISGMVTLSPIAGQITFPVDSTEFYKVEHPTATNTGWPDPLVPLLVPSIVPLAAGRNNPVLADILVPRDAPAGQYFANLTVDTGAISVVTPLVLTVWDITLPEKNTLQTWFDDSSSSWASAYGYQPWSSEHQALMKNVYAQYKKFRISPGNIDLGQVGRYNMSVSAGVVSVDFSGTDPWLSFCLDELNFTSFRFPLTGYSPRRADMAPATGHPDGIYYWGAPPYDMNPLYADQIGQYIKLVADHYRQKGWLDKAYVYVTDEPVAFNDAVEGLWQHPDYHVVQQFYNLTKANAPDLKFANTVQPVPELYGYTDVWASPGGYYHELNAQGRMAANQSVWWYNVDAGIASPGTEGRALYWDTFSRGVQGVLYWGTNYWDYYTVGNDPWNGSTQNGDGYLFYPGTKVGLTDDVCPSLRLFLARDGIEDFELLNMYGDKFGWEAARAVAESVAAGSSFAGARHRPVEARTIFEIREWLAGQITRQTADLAWTDTFQNGDNVSAATDLAADTAWEGSWSLGPANPPFLVDNLDAIGSWRPNNQPHIFSSVMIDTAVRSEGTGSLRIDFWRDDDPGELGGYNYMRNGRVVTNTMAITDWSGFDLLEMDVRSVDHPAGSLFMLVGDAGGTVVSSNLHRYARYTGGPGDNWTHVVIDISGRSRSSIQYIEPIVYNYFLEVPFKHYSYWIDNITVRKAGCRPAGSLVSKPIDLGPVGHLDGLEYLSQWELPAGAGLSFETRSGPDSVNWSPWAPALPADRFGVSIASPAARYFQYRADFTSPGAFPPVLSEVRIVYGPPTQADLFIENLTFDPPVPDENEPYNITATVGNIGWLDVTGANVSFSKLSVPFANLSVDILAGESFALTVTASDAASLAGWPVSARISVPGGSMTDPVEGNNEVFGWVLVNDRPHPAIDAPAAALVGEEAVFNASGSTDWQGIERYVWSFPDIELEGPVVNRSFASAGVIAYWLTVTDIYGAGGRLDASFAVYNHTPVPSFVVAPGNGTVRTAFTFISTAFDPDDTVVNTTWLFGDGYAGFGRVVNHTFPDDQNYTVDCTVDFFENGSLRRATASRDLKIENLPPVARFTATNDTAGKRKLLGFDASASSDPDDELSESGFLWQFGDGSNATGRMASHSFTRSGAYNVTLTVTDDDSARSVLSLPVNIINQLPAAEFAAPHNVSCNRTFSLDASRSNDPDGSIVAWRWEFDDGTNGSGRNVTHSFHQPGLHAVTLVVTDDEGATGRLTKSVRADPEPITRPPLTGPATTNEIHPAVYVVAGLLVLFIVLFVATRARPRPMQTSRWSMARPASGPGAPASARGPPLAVPPATVVVPEPPGPAPPPAALFAPAPPARVAPAPAPATSAGAPAPHAAPSAPSRQPPRVVRTIPPPPPRLVRSIPAPPDSALIDLESARVSRVAEPGSSPQGRSLVVPDEPWRLGAGAPVKGQVETRPSQKREPQKPNEPSGEEADPTLPSNPWAEKNR